MFTALNNTTHAVMKQSGSGRTTFGSFLQMSANNNHVSNIPKESQRVEEEVIAIHRMRVRTQVLGRYPSLFDCRNTLKHLQRIANT